MLKIDRECINVFKRMEARHKETVFHNLYGQVFNGFTLDSIVFEWKEPKQDMIKVSFQLSKDSDIYHYHVYESFNISENEIKKLVDDFSSKIVERDNAKGE